jgi:hypothetical protein
MAKKIKNPEMLVAEIHTQQSKYNSLENQFNANKAKVERLLATNEAITKKAHNLKAVLDRNMKLAQDNGIPF